MKSTRKLVLRREALGELSPGDLRAVAGGSALSAARAATCCATCDPVGEVTRIISPLIAQPETIDMDCTTQPCAGS